MPANFTELTRVQIPALLHLERLDYTFVPREKLGENQDLNSNILTDVFKESVCRLNPAIREAEIEVIETRFMRFEAQTDF